MGTLRELFEAYADRARRARRHARDRAHLERLDDRLLSDIGLTRADIADIGQGRPGRIRRAAQNRVRPIPAAVCCPAG